MSVPSPIKALANDDRGTFRVYTESSSYLLTLTDAGHTLTRTPGAGLGKEPGVPGVLPPAADLRADYQPFELLRIERCEVGERAVFLVRMPPGVPVALGTEFTDRVTTIVRGIEKLEPLTSPAHLDVAENSGVRTVAVLGRPVGGGSTGSEGYKRDWSLVIENRWGPPWICWLAKWPERTTVSNAPWSAGVVRLTQLVLDAGENVTAADRRQLLQMRDEAIEYSRSNDDGDPGAEETWAAIAKHAAAFGVDRDSLAHVVWRAQQDGVSGADVLEGYRRATRLRAGNPEGPPYAATNSSTPGLLDLRVLDQHIWWTDTLARRHVIADRADLTDEYLANVIGWLQHFAVSLAAGWARMHDVPAHADESVWLEDTVLLRALRAEAEMRGISDRMPRPDGNGVGDR